MLASWHCGGVGQQTVYSPPKPQQRVAGLCAMRMLIGYKWRGKEVEKHENHEKQHAKLRPADSAAHWMTGHRGGHRPHLAAQLLDQHKTCVKAVNESQGCKRDQSHLAPPSKRSKVRPIGAAELCCTCEHKPLARDGFIKYEPPTTHKHHPDVGHTVGGSQ